VKVPTLKPLLNAKLLKKRSCIAESSFPTMANVSEGETLLPMNFISASVVSRERAWDTSRSSSRSLLLPVRFSSEMTSEMNARELTASLRSPVAVTNR